MVRNGKKAVSEMEKAAIKDILEAFSVRASAPCRIDMGGTLDIRTFYLPLQKARPCTVNMALDLRTEVELEPYDAGMVKVSSLGFDPAIFPAGEAPYRHPLGLMFAVADAFSADGLHIRIRSASPPRSALGGSSVAAVGLVAALARAGEEAGRPGMSPHEAAMLAHAVEEAVAGVPCGTQDQLAAAFGGVNVWHWQPDAAGAGYRRHALMEADGALFFSRHVLVAYCGAPHESHDINGRWVRAFLAGEERHRWRDIAVRTSEFAAALERRDLAAAVAAMNRETDLRRSMTPDVLDAMGEELVAAARHQGCAARFTGAGGGGCLWALGEENAVSRLRTDWETVLGGREDAARLAAGLDTVGLQVDCRRRK